MAIHFILIVGHKQDVQNYTQAVSFPGYLPIVTDTKDLLTEALDNENETLSLLELSDILILPGGGDISPHILGEKDLGSTNIDEDLDHIQLAYANYFISNKKPIIGICKGMQLLNFIFGGTLIQDMSPDRLMLHKRHNSYDNNHSCNYDFTKGPQLLSDIFNEYSPNYINSAHHQCIKKLATDFYAFQHASDGTIEGIVHKTLPILGLQWHPERKMCQDGNYLKIYLYRMIKYSYNKGD